MQEYSGNWDRFAAGHLLRRTLFGPTQEQINDCLSRGMHASIDLLLNTTAYLDLPRAYNSTDPVGIGNTWINAPFDPGAVGPRINSLQAWWIYQMLHTRGSIQQKLTLFWHNHFVVEALIVRDARMLFRYYDTLHQHALGNVRLLTEKITLDAAMLRYLNGDINTRISPNENYARELFELFTIGKGPQIADGNYTHFTEQDVFAAARALTGWRINGQTLEVFFQANLHDNEDKQFSDAFDGQIISNQGSGEYQALIQMIFKQKETAKNICRKLYRWFVYHDISEEVETEVILPLAERLYADDYEIKGALRLLLTSAHFYNPAFRGAMIKSPLDFVLGTLHAASNINGAVINLPVQQQYGYWRYLSGISSQMQMIIGSPPQVAGWEAYYQAPSYYRTWVSSATLPIRKAFLDALFSSQGLRNGQVSVRFQYISLVEGCSDPEDVRVVTRELSALFLAHPLSQGLEDFLVEALIPGLPEYEWGNQWRILDSNPQDSNLKMAIEAKLQAFFAVLCHLPEFQLG
jgi:hypothetical protein